MPINKKKKSDKSKAPMMNQFIKKWEINIFIIIIWYNYFSITNINFLLRLISRNYLIL
jgi:hypothetical protein